MRSMTSVGYGRGLFLCAENKKTGLPPVRSPAFETIFYSLSQISIRTIKVSVFVFAFAVMVIRPQPPSSS